MKSEFFTFWNGSYKFIVILFLNGTEYVQKYYWKGGEWDRYVGILCIKVHFEAIPRLVYSYSIRVIPVTSKERTRTFFSKTISAYLEETDKPHFYRYLYSNIEPAQRRYNSFITDYEEKNTALIHNLLVE